MLSNQLLTVLLLGARLVFTPASTVLLTVQVIGAGDVPASGIELTLTQQPSGATYPPCRTDGSGRCRWRVPGLRLYEIGVMGQGVSAETAAALGHAGLRGLGVMLGADDHVQRLFLVDGNVYVADPRRPSAPYIPAAGESSRHLVVTPALMIEPTATPTPTRAAAAAPDEPGSPAPWAGLLLLFCLALIALTGIVIILVGRRQGANESWAR